MPSTPEPHEQWYVLHVLSGQENSVRDRIIRKAKDAELSDFIYRVEVPTELISEVRNGKKTERHSKLFPGYVYANMYLLEADGTLHLTDAGGNRDYDMAGRFEEGFLRGKIRRRAARRRRGSAGCRSTERITCKKGCKARLNSRKEL